MLKSGRICAKLRYEKNLIHHISIAIKLTKELQIYQVFITCCVLAMTIPGLVIDWHLMMSSASVNQSQWESTVTSVNHKGDTLLCCQTIDSRDFEVSNFVKKMMSYCACVSYQCESQGWHPAVLPNNRLKGLWSEQLCKENDVLLCLCQCLHKEL